MMKLSAFLSKILFMVSVAISAQSAVWVDTNKWDESWEDRYSEWVKTQVTRDMFTNINSPYYGIETDCADFVYFTRAIFAKDNSLPFIVNTRWGGESSERISNRTTQFDRVANNVSVVKVRNDQGVVRDVQLPRTLDNGKMRAFLDRIGHRVGTVTLPVDTYPVKIDKQNLRAGVVFLRQGYNRMSTWEAIRTFLTGTPPNPNGPPGHVLLVHDVRRSGAIEFIQSTLPKKVRELSLIYEIELLPTNAKVGFRRFVQPQQVGMAFNSNLPGYSLEQFTELGREVYQNQRCNEEPYLHECQPGNEPKSDRRNITVFRKEVMGRLASQAESSEEQQERLVKTICGAIHQRADVILTAEPYRVRLGGRCMDAGNYDNYSTPSRDEQIRQFIKQISFFSSNTRRLLNECGSVKIDYTGRMVPISELVSNFGRVSSNPNEDINVRWGLAQATNRCADPGAAH